MAVKFENLSHLLERVNARDHPDGYYKSGISFPRNPMMGLRSPKANCLYGFWIAYIRDERYVIQSVWTF